MNKIFLLSFEGERHEDRLPIACFSKTSYAKKYIKTYGDIESEKDFHGDYGRGKIYYMGDCNFVLESFGVDAEEFKFL